MSETFEIDADRDNPIMPLTISADFKLQNLKTAWRAAHTIDDEGRADLVISHSMLRLRCAKGISVEGRIACDAVVGLPGTDDEICVSIPIRSLAALGIGELQEDGRLILKDIVMTEGHEGTAHLSAGFAVSLPYTVTRVGKLADAEVSQERRLVDPRSIGTALAELRDFASGDGITGPSFHIVQIENGEGRALSGRYGRSLRSSELMGIELRVPAKQCKRMSSLLSQLEASEAHIEHREGSRVISDASLTIPLQSCASPPLVEVVQSRHLSQFQCMPQDLTEAFAATRLQSRSPVRFKVLTEESVLRLSWSVPGGFARYACDITSPQNFGDELREVLIDADALSIYSTRKQCAISATITENALILDQSDADGRNFTVLGVRRPTD